MMRIVEIIQNNPIATWVRESTSIFAYTSVLTVHSLGLAILVGLNTALALRMLRVVPAFALPPARKLFAWMYLGLWLNAVSGILLLMASLDKMLTTWIFYPKLVFIGLATFNLVLTQRLFRNTPDEILLADTLPAAFKRRARLALVLWGLALISGRLISYPKIFGF